MTKSIVTGGAGFIGSHLADKLIEMGHDVTIIDDLSTGDRKNIPKRAHFYNFSLGNPDFVRFLDHALIDADYVFHLAANPQIDAGLENPLETHIQTVDGTVQLLDRMRRMQKIPKLILSSSCAVYGNNAGTVDKISETLEVDLTTPYAVQKYSQELYVTLFAKLWGIPTVILRYFNVYGTKRQSESGAYPNVIASFAKNMKEKGRIWITGDGKQARDYVHVYDVVDANISAMNSDLPTCEIFNVGIGSEVTINDIADNFKCERDYISARPGDIMNSCADTSKINNLLGWKAQISFQRGMNIYLNS